MITRASVPEGKSLFFKRTDRANPPHESDADEMQADAAQALIEPQEVSSKLPTRQSAIWLTDRQIDWLEEKCREARKSGGKAIKRAAIVRALLNVAMESSVDLRGVSEEGEVVERIRQAIVRLP